MKKQWLKKDIIELLDQEYNGKVFEISTEGFPVDKSVCRKGPKKKGELSLEKWADETVETIANGTKRSSLCQVGNEINFAYIKFAETASGEVVGLIGGKSCFHKGYRSDVNFYDYKDHESALNYLAENKLKIYTKDILVLVNKEPNSQNAEKDEDLITNLFGLFASQKL